MTKLVGYQEGLVEGTSAFGVENMPSLRVKYSEAAVERRIAWLHGIAGETTQFGFSASES